jgi:hypothetical protein
MQIPNRNSTLPGALAPAAPEMARIAVAVAVSGLSRSALYRAAGEGRIIMRKCGRSTLVCMQSVRAFIEGLPRATIRPPRGTAAAQFPQK